MKFWFSLMLLTTALAPAATLTVAPGTSIQEKIDAAQAGDTIAILEGTYAADISIGKAVRLVAADGDQVSILGKISFVGLTNPPAFEGFVFGSPGTGMEITNCTGLTIANCDGSGGLGIKVIGNSSVSVVGGASGAIEQSGGKLVVSSCTVGLFTASSASLETVCMRSTVASTDWQSKRSCFAYSKAKALRAGGTGTHFTALKSIIEFPDNTFGTAVDLYGTTNHFTVANCELRNLRWGNSGAGERVGRGISVQFGNTALICNNYIDQQTVDTAWDFLGGDGIVVLDPRSMVCNNLVVGSNWAINAPFGATVTNNAAYAYVRGTHRTVPTGGAPTGMLPTHWVLSDPLFIPNQRPKLQSSSPCINGGVTDPRYNDLDGTRNDIGPGGGCFFDPDGWTTDKPVVISFDLGPDFLVKGVDTQVTLENGQAISGK